MSEEIGSSFSVWNVFKKSFGVIKNDFPFFISLIVALMVIYSLPNYFYYNEFIFVQPEVLTEKFMSANFMTIVAMVGAYLILIALFVFYYVIVVDRTYAQLNNLSFENYPYVSRCLTLLFPLMGLYIIYGLFTMVGMVFLIIPGLIIFAVYYVAAPARILENIGVFAAMSRSRALTKGHRWGMLGIYFIPYLLILIISIYQVNNMISDIQETGNLEEAFSIEYQLINGFISYSFFTFIIVASVVAYNELVKEKEGI